MPATAKSLAISSLIVFGLNLNAMAGDHQISRPPGDFDPFYQKYIDVDGVAILGSENVTDQSMQFAAEIIDHMLSHIPYVAQKLAMKKTRVSIIALNEKFTDLPEERRWSGKVSKKGKHFENGCGGGAVRGNPVTVTCERNLLNMNDPFHGRYSVLIHEFGHTIQNLGLDEETKQKIEEAYAHAREKGLYMRRNGRPSYLMSNVMEYFAETTTMWFNSYNWRNGSESPAVRGRQDLKTYDPEIYAILASLYPDDDWAYPRVKNAGVS